MALGRQGERQVELMVGWTELPRSPGHAFYDRVQAVLVEAGFDSFAESRCAPYYASQSGRPSLPPGRYFRMVDAMRRRSATSRASTASAAWNGAVPTACRCGNFCAWARPSRCLTTPHLSKTRARLPLEVHEAMFAWVLQRLTDHGLIKGGRIGVDASSMEANAALRSIVRRDSGEGYREMLKRLAAENGIATPTAEDLIRLDRQRKGKQLSNQDWASPTDPEAKVAKMKDGRTRLAYKPEHAVDLDTGAIVAAEIHPADQGDTTTLPETLKAAAANLAAVHAPPTPADPAELVADKGYHSRNGLKDLEDGAWKSRIAEKKVSGVHRWRGDRAARRAVYNNRARLRSGAAKEAFKLRAELVERSFALTLDRGGMRRAWLRGRENLQKRYLVHVAGYNLGLIMRLLVGAGTPRQHLARASAHLLLLATAEGPMSIVLIAVTKNETAMLVVGFDRQPQD